MSIEEVVERLIMNEIVAERTPGLRNYLNQIHQMDTVIASAEDWERESLEILKGFVPREFASLAQAVETAKLLGHFSLSPNTAPRTSLVRYLESNNAVPENQLMSFEWIKKAFPTTGELLCCLWTVKRAKKHAFDADWHEWVAGEMGFEIPMRDFKEVEELVNNKNIFCVSRALVPWEYERAIMPLKSIEQILCQ